MSTNKFVVITNELQVSNKRIASLPSFSSADELRRAFPSASSCFSFDPVDFGVPVTGPVEVFWNDEPDASWRAKWRSGEIACEPLVAHVLSGPNNRERNDPVYWECAPNVWAVPITAHTSPPFRHTNLVVVKSTEATGEFVVVDPGGCDENSLKEAITRLVLPTAKRVWVLITHKHKDHWNSLQLLLSLLESAAKVVVCASAACLAHVPNFGEERRELPMDSDTELLDGLFCISTPGHTDGDLSLFCPKLGYIAVGDHCVGFGSSLLDGDCGDMDRYLKTCEKVLGLRPLMLIPAHGPLCYDPETLLKTYIKHRLDREEQIRKCMVEKGCKTPQEIVEVVYRDTPKALWPAAMSNISLHLKRMNKL